MIGIRSSTNTAMGALVLAFLFGCSADAPSTLGLTDNRLAACPDKPNCVASDAEDEAHRIAPFHVTNQPAQAAQAAAWSALKEAVAELPRTVIVTVEDTYLHAEARSRVFGFVDDLEFQLRPDDDLIALRSAARTGHSDFGVNAERLETLRARLQTDGILP